MKTRESGMPDMVTWEGFFDPGSILRKLDLNPGDRDVVDFGCGYGTFSLAAARIATGTIFALDIEPDMVETTTRRAGEEGLSNVKDFLLDFAEQGTGLSDRSIDFAMIFNILHAGFPELLLNEASRILTSRGRPAVIHWIYDPDTPRGPPMEIRLKPEECIDLASESGFDLLHSGVIDLPPYHFGMVFTP